MTQANDVEVLREVIRLAGAPPPFYLRKSGREALSRLLAVLEERAAPHDDWRPTTVMPEVGRKFVALHSDGSGAALLVLAAPGVFIDSDGDEYGALGKHQDLWAYLPDDFTFWCERRSDDPVTLPSAPPVPVKSRAEDAATASAGAT